MACTNILELLPPSDYIVNHANKGSAGMYRASFCPHAFQVTVPEVEGSRCGLSGCTGDLAIPKNTTESPELEGPCHLLCRRAVSGAP